MRGCEILTGNIRYWDLLMPQVQRRVIRGFRASSRYRNSGHVPPAAWNKIVRDENYLVRCANDCSFSMFHNVPTEYVPANYRQKNETVSPIAAGKKAKSI